MTIEQVDLLVSLGALSSVIIVLVVLVITERRDHKRYERDLMNRLMSKSFGDFASNAGKIDPGVAKLKKRLKIKPNYDKPDENEQGEFQIT